MIATTRHDSEPMRLQIRPRRGHGITDDRSKYRAARLNGWHCGHWHRTPEDAVACAAGKGAPMD